MYLSFRLKTILGIVLIESVMLVTIVWSSLNYLYESNVDEFNRRTITTSQLFASTVKDAVLTTDLASLKSYVDELIRNPGLVYIRVSNLETILTQDGDPEFLNKPFSADKSYEEVDDGVYDTSALLKEGTYIFGKVEIGFSTDTIKSILKGAKQHIIFLAALEIILVTIFSIILGIFLTKQLQTLQNAANKIRHLGPGCQIKVKGNDELAQTARAFNAMSAELETSYESLRGAMHKSHEQKEKVDAIMDNVPSGMAVIDEAGTIISINRSMTKLFNLKRDVLENASISDLIEDWERIFDQSQLGYHLDDSKFRRGWDESSITRHDQTLLPVQVSIAMLHTDDVIQYIVVLRDISEHVYSEKQLSQSNDLLVESVTALEDKNNKTLLLTRFSNLLQKCVNNEEAYQNIVLYGDKLFPNMSGTLYINDGNDYCQKVSHWGKGDEVSQRFYITDCWAIRGASIHPPSLSDKSAQCSHIKIPRDDGDLADLCIPISAKGKSLGIIHLCGEHSYVQKVDRAFANLVKEQISMALYNISLQNQLHDAAIRDKLSGLYNRRFMEESFQREIHRAFRNKNDLTVIMLDIDYFKRVNDTLGHMAGDLVIKEFSTLLINNSRRHDIVCRYGGEEFIMIYPDTSLEISVTLGESILESIRELDITFDGQLIPITASAGVASYRTHGSNALTLIESADKALYQAKQSGRNKLCVSKYKPGPKLIVHQMKPDA